MNFIILSYSITFLGCRKMKNWDNNLVQSNKLIATPYLIKEKDEVLTVGFTSKIEI